MRILPITITFGGDMSEEKISKLKNILPYKHRLYTILCYIAYIAFIIFMGFVFFSHADDLKSFMRTISWRLTKPQSVLNMAVTPFTYGMLLEVPLIIVYTICLFKSIKAIINKTFSFYRITIKFLIISGFFLPEMLIFPCACSSGQRMGMSIYIFLLIPLIMTIKSLIKRSKNITSTLKIIINRILIGALLMISAGLIVGFITLANHDPHAAYEMTDEMTVKTFEAQ